MAKSKPKTIGNLMKFRGILEGDTEYDEVMKELKKGWNKWSTK